MTDDYLERAIRDDYDVDNLSELQEFLLNGYYRWAGRRRRGRGSERSFAETVLGVKSASWNNWVTRGSKPDLLSCIQLSKTYGPKIFELCGYPPAIIAEDQELLFIASVWEDLEPHERNIIVEHVKASADANSKRRGKPN